MTEYTAHVMVPDVLIGGTFQDYLLGAHGIACATLRSGGESWLSLGFSADSDDDAVMHISAVREQTKSAEDLNFPEGYGDNAREMFAGSPMIVTHGRTVVYSEGV